MRSQATWLEFIAGRNLEQSQVLSLVLSLLARRDLGDLVFDVESGSWGSAPRFYLRTTKPAVVASSVSSFLDGSRTRQVERTDPAWCSSWRLQSSTSLQGLDVERGSDASRRLLQVLSSSPRSLTHRVTVSRRLPSSRIASNLKSKPAESWTENAIDAVLGPKQLDPSRVRDLVAKHALAGAEVSVQLLAPLDAPPATQPEGPSESRLMETFVARSDQEAVVPLGGYLAALRALESPGIRLRLRPNQGVSSWLRSRSFLKLNAAEIVAVLGWPLGEDDYPGLGRDQPVVLPHVGPRVIERRLGEALEPEGQPVGLLPRDNLRHLHVLGPTGVGKSTMLLHLALQDIAAERGLVVVDPKGDLVDDILANLSEKSRDRVVVLDPSRNDFSVGFNPLDVSPSEGELAVDGIAHIFASIYKDNWGPRTSDIFHSSCLTLVGTPFASLVHIPRLLGDEGFRRQVLSSKRLSPPLASFWSWFNTISTAERFAATAPLMNKLRPLLNRSGLHAMLAQTNNQFHPGMVFEEQLVLLVPLRKGRLGPSAAKTFGSMLLSRLWLETLRRSNRPTTDRQPITMILDEFQDYLRLDLDFTDILAQGRGLGVGLALAHQHLGQLTPDVRAAIDANAASKVFFGLGQDDAKALSRHSDQLDARDLAGLPPFNAYAQLLHHNEVQPWTSIRTFPPPPTAAQSSSAIAKELAQAWGRPISDVEKQRGSSTNTSSVAEADDIGPDAIGRKRRVAK